MNKDNFHKICVELGEDEIIKAVWMNFRIIVESIYIDETTIVAQGATCLREDLGLGIRILLSDVPSDVEIREGLYMDWEPLYFEKNAA